MRGAKNIKPGDKKIPDHRASIEPDVLKKLIASVRHVETAIGDGVKQPHAAELKNRDIARKSLVARKPIVAGELLSANNVSVKRPGAGISPLQYWKILGRPADRDYLVDEMLDCESFNG